MLLTMVTAGQATGENHDMYCAQYDYYPDYMHYAAHQEMCAMPPTTTHVCTVHGTLPSEYGPMTVPMVSTSSSPPMPMPMQVPPGHVVQQVVDEHGTLRHVILSTQPPLLYAPGPANGSNQAPPPQPYFPAGGLPPGYPHPHYSPPLQPGPPGVLGHVPAPQPGPSPPPHSYHKDERSQRQYSKLKRKFQLKQQHSATPPVSPRRDGGGCRRNGNGVSSMSANTNESLACALSPGDLSVVARDDEETSSSVPDDEEETQLLLELLGCVSPPKVTELKPRSALLQWSQPERPPRSQREGSGDGKPAPEVSVSESDYRYEVLLSDKGSDGQYRCIYSGEANSCRVNDLQPATEYSICLQALLEDSLRGTPSEPVVITTPPCEPDAPPTPRLISRSRTALSLKWNAATDNGSSIKQYILQYDEGKGGPFVEIYRQRGKQYTVSKLQASTSYRFQLAAVNELGQSGFSEIVSLQTAGSPPQQPAPPVLREATPTSLHLAWQRRPNDEEYTLQMEQPRTGHGYLPVYNGREIHCSCNGLERYSEYKFRLRSQNEEGESRWSDEVSYRTLAGRPAAPSRPFVKGRIHAHSFKVRYEPPTDRGGMSDISYTLEIDSGSGFKTVYSGSQTEVMCDHLSPGTTHKVRVCCISGGGQGDFSEVTAVTTEAVCPGQCSPPRLHGKPRANSLTLKWNYPEATGGAEIKEFEVDVTSSDSCRRQAYRGKETECLVTELSPGRPYLLQVRALNRIGAGPWSDPLEIVSGAGPPEAPCSPSVSARSPHAVLVQWKEPLNNGATVTEYRLEMAESAVLPSTEPVEGEDETCVPEFSLCLQGPGLSHEVKGLTPATHYAFRIQAFNSAGGGLFSPVAWLQTPAASPGGVAGLQHSTTSTSISLSWKEPPSNGSDISHYNIDLGDRTITTPDESPNFCLEDLSPDTTYRIRVQALNSVGPGPFSSTLKVTTRSLPPSPPRLDCIGAGHNALKLKWGDGKNLDFTQFTVEMESPRSQEFHCVYQGTSHNCKISKLLENTLYRFRIIAANDAGEGPPSQSYEFTTTRAPPSLPKGVQVSHVELLSCRVHWSPCPPVGGDNIIYQLQLSRHREQDFRMVYRGSENQATIRDLDSGTEYCVRVCAVRLSPSGDLQGAYSSPVTFSTPAPQVANETTTSRPSQSQTNERKRMTDQQWAMVILSGFTLFAFVVAFVVHQVLDWSNRQP